jgi:hypothetical protein
MSYGMNRLALMSVFDGGEAAASDDEEKVTMLETASPGALRGRVGHSRGLFLRGRWVLTECLSEPTTRG